MAAPQPPRRAAIALGSNLGDRHAHIHEAIDALGRLPGTRVVRVSTILQTEAVPSPGSDPETVGGPFLNGVAIVETELSARELLTGLMAIEKAHGRRRDALGAWTPRTLDLDLVLFAGEVIETAELSVPHPRMAGRAFVLEPLAEVAGDWVVPGIGRTVGELWAELRRGDA